MNDLTATIPPSPRQGGTCTIARIRARLTGDYLEGFERCLANPDLWSNQRMSWLVDALIGDGKLPPVLACHRDTFKRHRSGACRCPR